MSLWRATFKNHNLVALTSFILKNSAAGHVIFRCASDHVRSFPTMNRVLVQFAFASSLGAFSGSDFFEITQSLRRGMMCRRPVWRIWKNALAVLSHPALQLR